MTKLKKITGLGKGLGALLPNVQFDKDKGFNIHPSEEETFEGGSIALIEINKIQTNPYQPRKDFNKQALEDLKRSILEHGIIQPITVRRVIDGYELIAGERRLRASLAGGLEKIPAYILDIDTGIEMLELALIENVQRENLNPIEIAHGYQRLIEECNLTQEQVAAKVGKDRTTITNFLRLLRLPERIQESLRTKLITMGHARALLGLNNGEKMMQVWNHAIEKELSVRAVESLVKDIESGKNPFEQDKLSAKKEQLKKERQNGAAELQIVLADTENNLRRRFGTKVKINAKSSESGTIEFDFYSKDDFERLIELFSNIDSEKY